MGTFSAALDRFLDNRNRSVELDFVRGVAILLVIGFHAMTPLTSFGVLSSKVSNPRCGLRRRGTILATPD